MKSILALLLLTASFSASAQFAARTTVTYEDAGRTRVETTTRCSETQRTRHNGLICVEHEITQQRFYNQQNSGYVDPIPAIIGGVIIGEALRHDDRHHDHRNRQHPRRDHRPDHRRDAHHDHR